MILPINRYIDVCGGIATTAELLRAGFSAIDIRMTHDYRHIVRVRKGVWANLGIAHEVILAHRVGGRLACVSALELYGLEMRGLSYTGPFARDIHVDVRRGASRLRSLPDRGIVLHWSRNAHEGDRQSVSAAVAREQMRTCTALT